MHQFGNAREIGPVSNQPSGMGQAARDDISSVVVPVEAVGYPRTFNGAKLVGIRYMTTAERNLLNAPYRAVRLKWAWPILYCLGAACYLAVLLKVSSSFSGGVFVSILLVNVLGFLPSLVAPKWKSYDRLKHENILADLKRGVVELYDDGRLRLPVCGIAFEHKDNGLKLVSMERSEGISIFEPSDRSYTPRVWERYTQRNLTVEESFDLRRAIRPRYNLVRGIAFALADLSILLFILGFSQSELWLGAGATFVGAVFSTVLAFKFAKELDDVANGTVLIAGDHDSGIVEFLPKSRKVIFFMGRPCLELTSWVPDVLRNKPRPE